MMWQFQNVHMKKKIFTEKKTNSLSINLVGKICFYFIILMFTFMQHAVI